jgi:hypothetical protein
MKNEMSQESKQENELSQESKQEISKNNLIEKSILYCSFGTISSAFCFIFITISFFFLIFGIKLLVDGEDYHFLVFLVGLLFLGFAIIFLLPTIVCFILSFKTFYSRNEYQNYYNINEI